MVTIVHEILEKVLLTSLDIPQQGKANYRQFESFKHNLCYGISELVENFGIVEKVAQMVSSDPTFKYRSTMHIT